MFLVSGPSRVTVCPYMSCRWAHFLCVSGLNCVRLSDLHLSSHHKNITPLHTDLDDERQCYYNLQIWGAQSWYSWNHPDPAPIYHPGIWRIITNGPSEFSIPISVSTSSLSGYVWNMVGSLAVLAQLAGTHRSNNSPAHVLTIMFAERELRCKL